MDAITELTATVNRLAELVQQMLTLHNSPAKPPKVRDDEKMLTRADVAELLGYVPTTITNLVRQGRFPPATVSPGKPGQRWRKATVQQWQAQGGGLPGLKEKRRRAKAA